MKILIILALNVAMLLGLFVIDWQSDHGSSQNKDDTHTDDGQEAHK